MPTTIMSQNDTPGGYVEGPVHPNTKPYATYETKPSVPGYTGGGYEHWRSTERRPHTPARGKEDVYASVHRLTAVVACYSLDTPLSDVLDDLHGRDVHHNAPEVDRDIGIPWDNRHSALEVKDHATHSSITQTQMRAWGEDTKPDTTTRERLRDPGDDSGCPGCGRSDVDVIASSPGFEGERCLECAQRECDGEPVEITRGDQ